MLKKTDLDFLKRLAKGISTQFGSNCEVAIHDLSTENTILAIENGHVTHRKAGDGPSLAVLEALKSKNLSDQIGYLTKNGDGRILKSTTIYIRDESDKVSGIFSINYDITDLVLAQNILNDNTSHEKSEKEPSPIPQNVNELLDELIEESVRYAGKPAPLMNKDDKIKAIEFLNNAGAFLITKSGDKVSNYFGISKFTLYSYIDAATKDNK